MGPKLGPSLSQCPPHTTCQPRFRTRREQYSCPGWATNALGHVFFPDGLGEKQEGQKTKRNLLWKKTPRQKSRSPSWLMAESCSLQRHLSLLPAWAGGGAGQDVGGDQPQSRQGAPTTQLVTRQGEQRSISDLWLEADGIRAKTRQGATDGPWEWKASSLLFSCFLECITLYNPPTPTPSVRDQLNRILPRQWSTAHTAGLWDGMFAKVQGLRYLLLPGGLLGGEGLEN